MFYAHFVLSKRGPLARIWLAAHWDKKLTKAHVFETNLEASVETIISPQVKMALRTSGHLLLGVVRIYNRKAKYLLADCNEAFVKIKMAFRPGVVDLPEDNREAQHNQIYLVEEFHDFDAPLPDISDININQNLTLNQSRIEEITMPEDVPTSFNMDEGFGGGMMGFGKEVDQFSTGDLQNMFYKEDNRKLNEKAPLGFGMDAGSLKGGFGDEMGETGMLDDNFMQGPGLFGEGESFLGGAAGQKQNELEGMETGEGAMDNQVMSPVNQQNVQDKEMENLETINTQHLQIAEPPVVPTEEVPQAPTPQKTMPPPQQPEPEANETTINRNETTLIANDEEAFVLEPLDITGVKDTRIRRKRKLVVDQVMELDGQTMREQLKDFSDIVMTMDMAPPTKKLMQWKELGVVEKLFLNPSIMFEDALGKLYQSNLHTDIPADLLDISNTQLNQQYGLADEDSRADDSSIQIARADITTEQNVNLLEQSSIIQQHKVDEIIPATDGGLPQVDYNSDDDYEPYSVGPPSPASSSGDVPRTTEPQAPEAPNISDIGDISGIPAPTTAEPQMPDPFADNTEPSMAEEESESYNDDVDDLRWNKRTQHLMHFLHRSYKHQDQLSFFQMTEGASKKQAVSKFYSLLVLAKQEACLLHQSESFSDVFIKKGPRFDTVLM